MNVTLRQLRVFRSVAEGRNFSRAGDQVGLSQPAVSRSILELESQLGLKLLDRTTREVVLTEAGQSLAARLERVLDDLDQTLQDVAGLASARGGKVRVASSPTLSANLMPACIATCAEQAPGIQFLLLDRIQQDVLDSVRSGEVDFGVVIEPSEADDLHCEAILNDPFVLVLPPSHKLAQKPSVRWSALDGQRLVLLDHASGSRRLIDQALERHGAQCEVKQQLGHPTTVFRMVEAGIGISVMPGMSLPPEGLAQLAVRPLLPRGHALAARTRVRWSALDGQPLVLLDHASGSRRLIDQALVDNGVQATVAQQLGHPTTVFRMVEAGIGISVMPMLSVTPGNLGGLVALPLLPRVERRVMLVHRRNRAPSPLAQRVWRLIGDVARQAAAAEVPTA